MEGGMDTDSEYRQIMLDAIHVCATYKPKFGKGKDGVTLEQFQDLYREMCFTIGWVWTPNTCMPCTKHQVA